MKVSYVAFYTKVIGQDEDDTTDGDQSLNAIVVYSRKSAVGAIKDFLIESCSYSRHEAVSLMVDSGINAFEKGQDSFIVCGQDKDESFYFCISAEELSVAG